MATPIGWSPCTFSQGMAPHLYNNISTWLILLSISGFGTGVAFSSVFIAVQASVDRSHMAPAISMLYLAQGFGALVGLAASSAVYQAGLRAALEGRLMQLNLDASLRDEVRTNQKSPRWDSPLTIRQVIANAVASVEYVLKAKGDIATAIVDSYVDGLWYSHFVSLLASLLAFALAALLRNYKL